MPHIRPSVEHAHHGLERRNALIAAAEPLPEIDDPAFGARFDRFGDARVVLLGAAAEGASEFFRARAAITRWLVEKRGFQVVALDADSADARTFDERVRGETGQGPPAASWAWRNREFETFLAGLADHNAARRPGDRVSVHGLDLHDLAFSMRMVVGHLDRIDAGCGRLARSRYGGLDPWAQEPGRMNITGRYAGCEATVTEMLREALRQRIEDAAAGEHPVADTETAERMLGEAEAYYRAMYYGGADAWNLRETHLFRRLKALLDDRGPDARAVVWGHNASVGDARATEMGLARDALSLGQLCREEWGAAARLIGFGCDHGAIGCAAGADGPMEVKSLRPALAGSHERSSHDAGLSRFLLDLRAGTARHAGRPLAEAALERFVGAAYHPDSERQSHYAECRLGEQYDGWVWFDETTAVTPSAAR
ncbi:MAG: erythromycin esterase family protein [Pseudomonadota bacterium]